ncbi:MAG: cytochrome c3 family protein, partial [Coriobacteriia bacterium]|nr:cytochrome c3 family protein [Coriobacteriia bacterium]
WDKGCSTGSCHIGSTAIHGRITPAHEVTATARQDCTRNCHSSDLRVEHAKSGSGRTPVSCVSCHTGRVAAMTASWDGTCASCHAGAHYSAPQAGTADCLTCHGTSGESGMAKVTSDSATAFASSGGDHSGTAASAHGVVAPGNAGGVSTGISCEACHSHVSPDTESKVDYRTSGLTATATAQSRLCFGCHSASSEETASGKPFAWNGRDVEAEFARASHHPVMNDEPTSEWSETETLTAFAQQSGAEFDLDQKFQMAVISTRGAELSYESYLGDPGVRRLMYFLPGNGSGWSQYDPELSAWNSWQYTPPVTPNSWASFGGFTAVPANGKVYVGWGGGYATRWVYVPADGSVNGTWTANRDFPSGVGWGSDAAMDAANGYVYYTRCQSDGVIWKWHYADETWAPASIQARDATGTSFVLGVGSSAAYSPRADRLFVIRRAGASVLDGGLYYVASPSTKSGPTTFVNTGIQVTRGDGTSAYTHMVRIDRGGQDYLAVIGQDDAGAQQLQVIGDLGSATPARIKTGNPPWAANSQYTLNLEWDGGDYLYASDYNASGTRLARIRIPQDPLGGTWGAWETVANPPAYGTGGVMTFADARPKPFPVVGYRQVGTISAEFSAPPSTTTWGSLEWTAERPAGTKVTLKVQGWDGSAFVDLPGLGSISDTAVDLSGIPVSIYGRLRLVATLITGSTSVSPRLTSWSVTARRPLVRAGVLGGADRAPWFLQWWPAATPTRPAVFTGAAQVATRIVSVPQATRRLFYAVQGGGTTRFDQYDPAAGAWNALGYDPADAPHTSNPYSSMTNLDEYGWDTPTVWMPAAAEGRRSYFNPTTGTWNYNTQIYNFMAAGSDGAWDPVHRFSYLSKGGGTNVVYRYSPGYGTWRLPLQLLINGVKPAVLGEASAIAYARASNRLYFLQAEWAGADNGLYYVNNPSAEPNVTTITATLAIPNVMQASYSNRMTYAKIGAADYLFAMGLTGPELELVVISDLGSSTPTLTHTLKYPWPFLPAYSSDLEWDGGSYLYAIEGQGSTGFARIAIPTDPVAGPWGEWEMLPGRPGGNWGMGGSGTFANYTPPNLITAGYATDTSTTPEILPASGATAWGAVSWTGTTPTGTTIAMDIQRWNGSAWAPISGYTSRTVSPVDLGALSVAANPRLRVVATLATTNYLVAPSVSDWVVSSGNGTFSLVSPEAVPDAGDTSWGTVSWHIATPAGASGSMSVQTWNGSAWADVPGFTDVASSPIDLSALSIADYPRLRLRASMTASTFGLEPSVDYWSISSRQAAVNSVASLTCVSCHGPHTVRAGTGAWDTARVSDPAGTGRVWADGAAPDTTSYCLACHSATVVDASISAGLNVPLDIRFTDTGAPFFPGWAKDEGSMSFTGSGHFATSGTRALCENCHDPHASDNARLAAWTRPTGFGAGTQGTRDNTSSSAFEENLCYQCHGNGVVGVSAPGAPDVASPASGAYRHPVAEAAGAHSDVETALGLSAANRHSECTDCHDPHAARPGVHIEGTSRPGGALRGATGVKPAWSATSAAGDSAVSYAQIRLTGLSTDREAYLCFKCHTAATVLPTKGGSNGLGSSDLSRGFNPANASYHDVLGNGRGVQSSYVVDGTTYAWPWIGTMVNGWTTSSAMTCTDCHTGGSIGQARGPHGSTTRFLLDPAYSADWESTVIDFTQPSGMTANAICSKCHQITARGDGVHGADYFSADVHRGRTCITCHSRVPHGWKRPRMLGYTTDPAPYRSTGLRGVKLRSRPTGWWQSTDCAASCTSFGSHGYVGGYWP